jgi:cytochrome b
LSEPSVTASSPARSDALAMVAVWDLPLRITHWLLAGAVLTAYFSANIFDTLHEVSGYTVIVLIVFRIAWGFAGSRTSRFASSVRPPTAVLRYLRLIGQGRPGRYLGLNPAGAAMALALLALLAISTASGWMQLTERFFGVAWIEAVHAWSSHLVLVLAIVHVLGVLLMCAVQRENLVRAMITGKKRERAAD